MSRRFQHKYGVRRQAFWLRLLAYLCMALIGVASTVQVCHSHDDAFEKGLLKTSLAADTATAGDAAHAPKLQAEQGSNDRKDGKDSNPESAVRCPLCVAMHSAMPVSGLLVQVAMVRVEAMAPAADGIERVFRWRFEMATRPPPAADFRA